MEVMMVQEAVQDGDGGRAPKATALDGQPETEKSDNGGAKRE